MMFYSGQDKQNSQSFLLSIGKKADRKNVQLGQVKQ
jgi:hypothetical protein